MQKIGGDMSDLEIALEVKIAETNEILRENGLPENKRSDLFAHRRVLQNWLKMLQVPKYG